MFTSIISRRVDCGIAVVPQYDHRPDTEAIR
jgi:hypothetical protein